MKKLLFLLVAFGLTLGAAAVSSVRTTPAPAPARPNVVPVFPDVQPQRAFTVEEARDQITAQECRTILEFLCSNELEGRMSGHPGNNKAAEYIAAYFQDHGLQPAVNGSYFQPFTVRNVNDHKGVGTGKTANIIGYLPGNDPSLKDEVVIIGAHMDHIGYGPSYSEAPNRREIHPGADDNASGTALVMQAAKASSFLKGKNRRTIVFMAFSGEEMGLIGATHYCNNPIWPLDKTVLMINQDMVGRYNNRGSVTCGGASNSSIASGVIRKIEGQYQFKCVQTGERSGGSDHAAFIRKGVKTLMFHTGQHNDYHTPGDTPNKIDYRGLEMISRFVFHVMWEAANY